MFTNTKLADFQRAQLWNHETPLEDAPNLAKALDGGRILVKRDDCNGLAFGGNKVRQLEYYLGDALSKGADTVLMTGAVQSNFVRTAAAACCKLGLHCHVQLEDRVPKDDFEYNNSGNVLLDQLFGATITTFSEGEDEAAADAELGRIAAAYENDGRSTYVVPMHVNHAPFGALGYLHAAAELKAQLDQIQVVPDRIFVSSGSGNTHAGLLVGMRLLGDHTPMTGVCVRRDKATQTERMQKRCGLLIEMLGSDLKLAHDDLQIDDQYLAPGYGRTGPKAEEAMLLAARKEGLMVDPVYTSKVMAAVVDYSRNNPDKTCLFIHTGGGPGLFGYASLIRDITGHQS